MAVAAAAPGRSVSFVSINRGQHTVCVQSFQGPSPSRHRAPALAGPLMRTLFQAPGGGSAAAVAVELPLGPPGPGVGRDASLPPFISKTPFVSAQSIVPQSGSYVLVGAAGLCVV